MNTIIVDYPEPDSRILFWRTAQSDVLADAYSAYNPMERRKFNRTWRYGRCGNAGKFNSDYISDNHYFSRYRFAFRNSD